MQKLWLLLFYGLSFGGESSPPKGLTDAYRLAHKEFDARNPVIVTIQGTRYLPFAKYDIVTKTVGSETVILEYIPDTVANKPSKVWRKGPTFRLKNLKSGKYLLTLREFPKCHRDPHPCTGTMWIGPLLNIPITVQYNLIMNRIIRKLIGRISINWIFRNHR